MRLRVEKKGVKVNRAISKQADSSFAGLTSARVVLWLFILMGSLWTAQVSAKSKWKLPDGVTMVRAAGVGAPHDELKVSLSPKVQLTFALEGEKLLGLTQARVSGVETTAPDTCFRPVLAEDMFGKPIFTHAMRLKEVRAVEGGVALVVETLATGRSDALQLYYNMAPDDAAMAGEESLQVLRKEAELAEEDLRTWVLEASSPAQKNLAQLKAHLALERPKDLQEL